MASFKHSSKQENLSKMPVRDFKSWERRLSTENIE